MRALLGAPILAALLLGACSNAAQPGHTFEIIEQDGIPVATSSAIPRFGGELFTYEKILVIRPDPDDEESILYGPSFFTLGGDGRYYVVDRRNHRIAVFDAEGNFVLAFGREGQGPGELQSPFLLEVRDDLVFVLDDRTTIFRTDGTFVDVLSSALGRFPRPAGNGLLVIEDTTRRSEGEQRYVGARVRVVDDAGDVVASIETHQVPTQAMLAYAGMASAFLTPDEEVIATTGLEPVVTWYGLDGRRVRETRIDLQREPVTAADRTAVEELWDRLIDRVEGLEGPGSTEFLRELKGGLIYPETKPFWTRPIIDGSGSLWLPEAVADTNVTVAGAPIETRPRFRVLDARGEFIGTTQWPLGSFDVVRSAIVGDRLLTMVWDEETEEILPTVYRIRPAVEGVAYPPEGDRQELP